MCKFQQANNANFSNMQLYICFICLKELYLMLFDLKKSEGKRSKSIKMKMLSLAKMS